MNPPPVLLIGGQMWTVEEGDLSADTTRVGSEVVPVAGMCVFGTATISLSTDYRDEPQRSVTVVHEILHALWTYLALNPRIEERYIRKLAPMLVETLRANPELVAYLSGREA